MEKNTMKRFTIATGICALLLIVTIFAAGCTSSSNTSATVTGASPQGTQTTGAASVSGQGTQVDSASTTTTDATTVNDDAVIDPYNSTSQSTTMVSDSEDLGDPIP
jgi:hypothetical protein